jgi:hypothetical protein
MAAFLILAALGAATTTKLYDLWHWAKYTRALDTAQKELDILMKYRDATKAAAGAGVAAETGGPDRGTTAYVLPWPFDTAEGKYVVQVRVRPFELRYLITHGIGDYLVPGRGEGERAGDKARLQAARETRRTSYSFETRAVQEPGDGVDLRRLQRFLEGQRQEDAGKPLRQHRLPGFGWANHQNVVSKAPGARS